MGEHMELKNKTILVTGADGFIGSHLTEMLLGMGCSVRALSQYNSFNYWGWLDDVGEHDHLEVVCGDVRDPNYCREIAKGIDVVFHLAALNMEPEYTEAYINLGTTLTRQGNLKAAVAAFTSALKIQPGNTGIYNNLGIALERKGEISEATAHYEKAIELDPE